MELKVKREILESEIMKHTIILLATVFLFGCAPSQKEIETADYGPYPAHYEELIKEHMKNWLLDPHSAVYEFEPPYKGYVFRGILLGGNHFGWVVKARINAKNAYGGYAGFKNYTFLIKYDKVIWP